MDVDDKLVFQAGQTLEDGAKAAAQMLAESASATAVQAVNDLVALGCAGVFLERGLRIPRDISLAGFGNIAFCDCFQVPLTTVRQPKYRLGSAAVAAIRQPSRCTSSRMKPIRSCRFHPAPWSGCYPVYYVVSSYYLVSGDWSTSTPSMRLEEMALSISACSRSTLSFCGDWRVNNSCLPRASPRSARYHAVRVGNVEGSAANWRSVIMRIPG
jgi:hypothetical protein